jgi:hypothetical protein
MRAYCPGFSPYGRLFRVIEDGTERITTGMPASEMSSDNRNDSCMGSAACSYHHTQATMYQCSKACSRTLGGLSSRDQILFRYLGDLPKLGRVYRDQLLEN